MTTIKEIKLHLKVLNERVRHLDSLVTKRMKGGRYNKTELTRVLRKIKTAKKHIADATYI